MTAVIDFTKPIEVVDRRTGEIWPARYRRHSLEQPDQYEIYFKGNTWTVDANNRLLGRTDSPGRILAELDVRNCLKSLGGTPAKASARKAGCWS